MKQLLQKVKSIKPSKKVAGIIAILVVLLGIGSFFAYGNFIPNRSDSSKQKSVAGCSHHTIEAKKLIGQKNYQQAYDQLSSREDSCATPPPKNEALDGNSAKARAEKITFSSDLAVAAYEAGDKEKAKQIAEAGLKNWESMSKNPPEGAIDPNESGKFNNSLANLFEIQADAYIAGTAQSRYDSDQ